MANKQATAMMGVNVPRQFSPYWNNLLGSDVNRSGRRQIDLTYSATAIFIKFRFLGPGTALTSLALGAANAPVRLRRHNKAKFFQLL